MFKYFSKKKPPLLIITSTFDELKRKNAAAKIIQHYFRARLRICSICCDNFMKCKYRVVLNCKHTFHFYCYNQLYIYNHKSCPDCRKNIKSLMYKSITLTLGEALARPNPFLNRRETLIGI